MQPQARTTSPIPNFCQCQRPGPHPDFMRLCFFTALVLCGFLFSSPAQAQGRLQPGYVVLLRGDTLRGLLEAPTRNTVMRGVDFKPSASPADKTFYPIKLLRAAGLTGGRNYVVRKMQPMMFHDTLRILLEPLVRGRVTLYRSSRNVFTNNPEEEMFGNSLSKDYYYVEHSNMSARPPFLLNPNRIRDELGALFSDCPKAPAITGKFEEPNLVQLVRQYNACPAR